MTIKEYEQAIKFAENVGDEYTAGKLTLELHSIIEMIQEENHKN